MYHGVGGMYPRGGGGGVGGNMQFRGPHMGVQGHNQQGQGHVGQQGGGGSQQSMGQRPMGQPQMQQVSEWCR